MLEALHDWQQFYSVVAGATATLIGLIFVGVSLGAHLVNDETDENIRTYVNPMLMNFVIVLVLACAMLVPTHTLLTLSAVIALISIVGLRQTVIVGRTMQGHDQQAITEDNHWLWHFLLPLSCYVLGLIVAVGLVFSGLPIWLNLLPLIALTLNVVAIRNIWLLVLWIARQR